MSSNFGGNSDENLIVKFSGLSENTKAKAGFRYKPGETEKSKKFLFKIRKKKDYS